MITIKTFPAYTSHVQSFPYKNYIVIIIHITLYISSSNSFFLY